jgi:hypothetical protein
MVRGKGAASSTLDIREHPTRPTRPEGAPGLIPSPAQARLFVRPVGSTASGSRSIRSHISRLHLRVCKRHVILLQ